jgi:diguanylate cyclase (GGDEF)-like protein
VRGQLDTRRGAIELAQFAPPLTIRQLVDAVHRVERIALDELALHDRLGATSEPWPVVAYSLRAAMLEIITAFVERVPGRPALHDQLTTLFSTHVFSLALAQETQRALRHEHGLSVILFDIDDLSQLNRSHGYGAGDQLLRAAGDPRAPLLPPSHDWVARYGEDSIAVLLPETTLDHASTLANRFGDGAASAGLIDHKTDVKTVVTVSASAVGTDLDAGGDRADLHHGGGGGRVMRAKMDGRNRVGAIALLDVGDDRRGRDLLGATAREVIDLIRGGTLRVSRRGRHYHIDRAQIEEFRAKRV